MEQAVTMFAGGLSSYFSGMGSGSATSMQGGATALSVLSELTAGRVARNEADDSAGMSFYSAGFARREGMIASRQAGLDAEQETIAGRARAVQLQEELAQTIGGQQVAFAASGVDPTQGTAARLAEQTERRAAEDIALERSNTNIARIQALIRGSTARRSANMDAATAEAEGYATRAKGRNKAAAANLSATEKIFDFGLSVAKRK